jgi:Ser/Thr protein kinase RdoA (MazF antagonist)
VVSAAGPVVVKRHALAVRRPADLVAEHALAAHLRRRHQPVPEVLARPDGDTTWVHGPWVYEVQRVAPGEDRYENAPSWTPLTSTGEAAAAGAALARFHTASRDHVWSGRPAGPLRVADGAVGAADPVTAVLAGVEAHRGVARFVAGRPGWEAEVERAFAPFRDRPAAPGPPLWTHGDWHGSNLLWAGDDVAGIIDLGLAAPASAAYDLATALERNVIGWLDLPAGDPPVHTDHARALVAGYRSVRPDVDAVEVASVLPVVHVPLALAELDYFVTVTDDDGDAAAAWGYLVDHADWFAGGAGQRLLTAVAGA